MSESKRPDDEGHGSDMDEVIRAEFDWSEVPPSTAVVEMVAIAADREPMALESLYDTIDPDALDMLICSGGTNSTNGMATVTFAFYGHKVTVQRDGTVAVRPDVANTEPE